MVPFSSSPQIHLPGQLLTPPANSQDEDLVTWASNRSRFIDMWGWLSFSGAAVHRINFNCSLMFSAALQIHVWLLPGFTGESVATKSRTLTDGLSFLSSGWPFHFFRRGQNLSKLAARSPPSLPPPSLKLPLSLSLSLKSVKNPWNQQATSVATKALHLAVLNLLTRLLTPQSLKLEAASCKPRQSPYKLAVFSESWATTSMSSAHLLLTHSVSSLAGPQFCAAQSRGS